MDRSQDTFSSLWGAFFALGHGLECWSRTTSDSAIAIVWVQSADFRNNEQMLMIHLPYWINPRPNFDPRRSLYWTNLLPSVRLVAHNIQQALLNNTTFSSLPKQSGFGSLFSSSITRGRTLSIRCWVRSQWKILRPAQSLFSWDHEFSILFRFEYLPLHDDLSVLVPSSGKSTRHIELRTTG